MFNVSEEQKLFDNLELHKSSLTLNFLNEYIYTFKILLHENHPTHSKAIFTSQDKIAVNYY